MLSSSFFGLLTDRNGKVGAADLTQTAVYALVNVFDIGIPRFIPGQGPGGTKTGAQAATLAPGFIDIYGRRGFPDFSFFALFIRFRFSH
jgi:hypothetical protein